MRAKTNCRQVQHWTDDLFDRLDTHAKGHGARLVAVIWQAGIGFTLIRICEGTRRRERAIKNAGGAVRYALARHIELFPPPEVEIWDRTHPDQRKHHQRTVRLLFVTMAGRPIHRATWAQI